jgi:hypothetical protein
VAVLRFIGSAEFAKAAILPDPLLQIEFRDVVVFIPVRLRETPNNVGVGDNSAVEA